jgi:hypothetical protein
LTDIEPMRPRRASRFVTSALLGVATTVAVAWALWPRHAPPLPSMITFGGGVAHPGDAPFRTDLLTLELPARTCRGW